VTFKAPREVVVLGVAVMDLSGHNSVQQKNTVIFLDGTFPHRDTSPWPLRRPQERTVRQQVMLIGSSAVPLEHRLSN